MNTLLEKTGFWLARYLQKELPGYNPASHTKRAHLQACLQPGDIVLVEGNLRISVAIKYLTQSTWSHACFYAGPLPGKAGDEGDPLCLIEADVVEGVIAVPLSKYAGQHLRICRPVKLGAADRDALVAFMISKIGMVYDIKNAIDLLRYLFPQPPKSRR